MPTEQITDYETREVEVTQYICADCGVTGTDHEDFRFAYANIEDTNFGSVEANHEAVFCPACFDRHFESHTAHSVMWVGHTVGERIGKKLYFLEDWVAGAFLGAVYGAVLMVMLAVVGVVFGAPVEVPVPVWLDAMLVATVVSQVLVGYAIGRHN